MKFRRESIAFLQWRGRKLLQQHLDFRSLQENDELLSGFKGMRSFSLHFLFFKTQSNSVFFFLFLFLFFFLRMRSNYKSKNWAAASVTENPRVSSLSNTSTISLKPCDINCKTQWEMGNLGKIIQCAGNFINTIPQKGINYRNNHLIHRSVRVFEGTISLILYLLF